MMASSRLLMEPPARISRATSRKMPPLKASTAFWAPRPLPATVSVTRLSTSSSAPKSVSGK